MLICRMSGRDSKIKRIINHKAFEEIDTFSNTGPHKVTYVVSRS